MIFLKYLAYKVTRPFIRLKNWIGGLDEFDIYLLFAFLIFLSGIVLAAYGANIRMSTERGFRGLTFDTYEQYRQSLKQGDKFVNTGLILIVSGIGIVVVPIGAVIIYEKVKGDFDKWRGTQ